MSITDSKSSAHTARMPSTDSPLTAVLAQLGYTHKPGRFGCRIVVDATGVEVYEGNCGEVIDWLCERGEALPSPVTIERWRRDSVWSDRAARLLKRFDVTAEAA